jgi:hypothetical protein
MYRIRQHFDNTSVKDITKTVQEELRQLSWDKIRPGNRVAIAAGSRGIANFGEILKAVVEFLKSLDARPFIFPAMGSHGGATAGGQVAVLSQLGVTDSFVQAPIRSSMDVQQMESIRGQPIITKRLFSILFRKSSGMPPGLYCSKPPSLVLWESSKTAMAIQL